jgi:Uma2 family endonuclease
LVNVAIAVFNYLRAHPIGQIVPCVGVIFDDYNGVIPDLVFATHERMRKALVGGRFQAAPDIAIGILSPGASNERRDRHVKLSLYAARGVGEYWIVDPENRSVEIHRRDAAGDLVFEKSVRQSDEPTCATLPGFSVRVDALFV